MLFALAFASLGVFSFVFFTNAQTVENLKDQKSLAQQKLEQINAEIKKLQTQINATRSKQASLKNEITLYDQQIYSTELSIQAKETQIDDANIQIKLLNKEIEKREAEIEQNKLILAELVRQINDYDSAYTLNVTLGSSKFSEFLDNLKYTQNIQDKMFAIIENIKEVKQKLTEQEQALESKRNELTILKDQLENTQASLQNQRSQKNSLLTSTKGLERNYQQLYSASSKEAADLQKEMADLDKSIQDKLGTKTISPGKGALAKPMDGVMTQGYGNTGFRALGYSFHNGVDLAAPAGAPVFAAADGVVIGMDTGEAAYGNWITIKHTVEAKGGARSIVTLYAHLRSFKTSLGKTVSKGDLIGYEGNTGNTTRLLYGPERGYHLHFTVFDAEGYSVANGTYVKQYGHYTIPHGITYNPLDFMK